MKSEERRIYWKAYREANKDKMKAYREANKAEERKITEELKPIKEKLKEKIFNEIYKKVEEEELNPPPTSQNQMKGGES